MECGCEHSRFSTPSPSESCHDHVYLATSVCRKYSSPPEPLTDLQQQWWHEIQAQAAAAAAAIRCHGVPFQMSCQQTNRHQHTLTGSVRVEYGLKRSLRPVWGGEATRHVPVSASSVPTASVRMSTHKGILDHHHSAGHRPASAVPTIAIPRPRCVTHGPWPDSASCDTQLTHLMAVGSPQRPLSGARQTKQTMRSFYGGASNQGAAMPGRMSAGVVTPGKSSPHGYLDYAARANTSLAKGVAILRQHCRPGTALSVTTAVFDWRMIRPETHACGADE